jgi:hypothetical protein
MPGPLVLDLVAALIQGGAAPASALRSVAVALERAGDARAGSLTLLADRVARPSSDHADGVRADNRADNNWADNRADNNWADNRADNNWADNNWAAGDRAAGGLDGGGGDGSKWAATDWAGDSGVPVPLSATEPGARTAAAVEESLQLASRAGLPPTALVQQSAEQERRRTQAAAMRAVRRLEVLLVMPAGLCLLPAFVLLGIVPVILDLIQG